MTPQTPGADVFFLPLAVADRAAIARLGLDAGVLSRRIPDFLHQLLNQGGAGPTGILEVQSTDAHDAEWVEVDGSFDAEEAFDMLPEGHLARALVLGTLAAQEGALALELRVACAEDLDTALATTVVGCVPIDDPALALRRVAERLERVLELPPSTFDPGLLTRSGPAFFAFLAGLDGAALSSGELAVRTRATAEDLLRPLAEAVRLDPSFGLALRAWHAAVAQASTSGRLDAAALGRLADSCLRTAPRDGEMCVAIAEHLSAAGQDDRALQWLRHAVHLDPPPPRGLESLGIVLANRGEVAAARNLWLAGLQQDGHPDFFAHLARLSFAHGDDDDAWDKIASGLRRIRERATRQQEWGDDGRGCGVLLGYLLEHFRERRAPARVAQALMALGDVLPVGEDRIELAQCLIAMRQPQLALAEVQAALAGELSGEARDRGVRVLMQLRVRNFEQRLAKAIDVVHNGRDPRRAVPELEQYRALEPAFWLATFHLGVARRRLGEDDVALDLMADVLRRRPGQPDALTEMAALFDQRGNPKRALECIEDALAGRPSDPVLLARRALYEHHLGRVGQARESLRAAMFGGGSTPELEEIRRQILS